MANRGEKHHKAKLSADNVREIRHLYKLWKDAGSRKGYRELAGIFGVSWESIRDVVTFRTWMWLR